MKKMLVADSTELNKSVICETFDEQYEILYTTDAANFIRFLLDNKDEIAVILIDDCIASEISEKLVKTLNELHIFDEIPILLIDTDFDLTDIDKLPLPYGDVIDSPIKLRHLQRRIANLIELFAYKNKSEKQSEPESPVIESYQVQSKVQNDNKLDIRSFEKCFVPVVESGSGRILSYDLVELSDANLDKLFDTGDYSDNITAFSLNSLSRILSTIYTLQKEETALPNLSILTMFNGQDFAAVISSIDEMLSRYPVNTNRICLLMAQEMLQSMSTKELAAFTEQIRDMGFRVGVYNAGADNFNIKCFTENMFDTIVFARSFFTDIDNGLYPVDLLIYFINYFSSIGTQVILPVDYDNEIAKIVKQQAAFPFGLHKNEFISLNDFKQQMNASALVEDYPILSHETSALVLNEKLYDEVLLQTRSFIMEWLPRTDSIKVSDSFKKMYGHELDCEHFMDNLKERQFLYPDDVNRFMKKLNKAHSDMKASECLVRVYSAYSQKYIWNKVNILSVKDSMGIPNRVVTIFVDISQRQEGEDHSVCKSRTDYIMSLYNQKSVENKIKNWLDDENNNGTDALIIAEVCRFDKLENQLGTAFATAMLKESTDNIKELFNDSDIIGRTSGNRFMIFVKHIDDCSKLSEKAHQICAMLSKEYPTDSEPISTYGKVGISLYPQCGHSYDELYAEALNALYFAKHNIHKDVSFSTETNYDIKRLNQ